MATIKTIDDYKADYNAARARGDATGMQAANDGANKLREETGQAKEYASADIAKIAAQGSATTPTPAATNTLTTQSQTSGGVPSGYKGSATGVQGSTSDQQADIDKMNRNSIAYYETSDPAERQRLHEENEALAAKLGSAVVFDSGTGMWNGRADQPQSSGANYSSWIEDMNKAQREATLAALRAAYEKNVAGLDRAQSAIAPQYQSARNEAAAQSELQKRNFAEYAAANGLNSGASGQAQLAFTNALQGNLSNLAAKEASTLADLELQRSQMETDYENAIAQAEAQGNYELAQQLYQEKVRQDEAMRQQMQWQAQIDLQNQQFQFTKDQAAIGNEQWNKQYETNNQQYNQEQAWQLAQYYAQNSGDYSLFKALGLDDAQIQAMKDYNNYLFSQANNSTTSSSGSGNNNQQKSYDPNQLFQAAYNSGMGPSYLMMNASKYGVPANQVEGLLANYQDWAAGLNAPSSTDMSGINLDSVKKSVRYYLESGSSGVAFGVVNKVWDKLTQAQKDELIKYFDSLGYTLGEG
ncbi:MAG TPA: hypothetical protein VN421_13970 [Pseudoflavonifractor sp.]|nr:hypothetical protein [Pseudoflavonifractor sp.]